MTANNGSTAKNPIHCLIIGAGPVGLFAVFELGLLGVQAHLIDILDKPGGQCAELYPDKPIYDIPGLPRIDAQALVDNLLEQIKPFSPHLHLGQMAETVHSLGTSEHPLFCVTTDAKETFFSRTLIIATGGGSFQPKKLPLPEAEAFENVTLFYAIRQKDAFKNQEALIIGGGDSALDWTIALSNVARRVTLLHRRNAYRAAPHTVEKVRALAVEGKVDLRFGQIIGFDGENGRVRVARCENEEGERFEIPCEKAAAFFGLTMRLGPLEKWGVALHNGRVCVDVEKFETNVPGIFAVGDVNVYPGKLKLILSGFHETALAAQKVGAYVDPSKKPGPLQYTTTSTQLRKRLGVL